tara:strand:- start:49583 stop:50278 length:696 start_codon:yes stop_codon:yes gene_type:complete
MSQLYLVRHGQASFGADNYDQLSPLGLQQSQWLGEYFHELGVRFDRVVTGSMLRQRQTADGILQAARQQQEVQTDTGFNEFDFHALAAVYCQISGIELPGTADGGRLFFQMLRRAMQAWSRDELHAVDPDERAGGLETWQQFHDRVHLGMQSIYAEETEQTVLVVSSGGAMAMAVSQVLGCGVDALIDLNMQTRNTGIHQFFFNPRGFQLAGFNALPHLQRKDRLKFLTYT